MDARKFGRGYWGKQKHGRKNPEITSFIVTYYEVCLLLNAIEQT